MTGIYLYIYLSVRRAILKPFARPVDKDLNKIKKRKNCQYRSRNKINVNRQLLENLINFRQSIMI